MLASRFHVIPCFPLPSYFISPLLVTFVTTKRIIDALNNDWWPAKKRRFFVEDASESQECILSSIISLSNNVDTLVMIYCHNNVFKKVHYIRIEESK